ncbi:MAG: Uma2 family endonuclease [Candidatus Kapaibacteriota bacterium]|jgi:Uma2 family endonuclease
MPPTIVQRLPRPSTPSWEAQKRGGDIVSDDKLPQSWRCSVDDYYTMAKSGVLPFETSPRMELIDGDILYMTAMGNRHFWAVGQLNALLFRVLAEHILKKNVFIAVQSPVQLSDYSLPEPDIALLRHSPNHDKSSLPPASDVLLLLEISDATLKYDRTRKSLLYAQAGIAEYWIVNLVDTVLEVLRKPENGIYTEVLTFDPTQTIAIPTFPDKTIPVGELFA